MDIKTFTFVGPSCGHHASYTFYKAIRYSEPKGNSTQTRIRSLGEFFFVKIWPDSDIVSIGELQLLWEDKNTNQTLASLRLYFLPECIPEGRMWFHGEHEVLAMAEKAVIRVSDLLEWIIPQQNVNWTNGLHGTFLDDNESDVSSGKLPFDPMPFGKLHQTDFYADINAEKISIGDVAGRDDYAVIILSTPQYCRYRGILKRISGLEGQWLKKSALVSLGGFLTPTRNTFVLFCKDTFDYAELEEHPFLCNHLAPKLKGRPRKKKLLKRADSPESESEPSSESSVSTAASNPVVSNKNPNVIKNGIKKDLLSMLRQKNTKEEVDFLKKLIAFMERRKTPIERPPMLGFKQIDLHSFFDKVNKGFGGYDGCMLKKCAWKTIYDDLGGNPQNTSAATCTRRHYERFLLPYERHMRSVAQKKALKKRASPNTGSSNVTPPQKSPKREFLRVDYSNKKAAGSSPSTNDLGLVNYGDIELKESEEKSPGEISVQKIDTCVSKMEDDNGETKNEEDKVVEDVPSVLPLNEPTSPKAVNSEPLSPQKTSTDDTSTTIELKPSLITASSTDGGSVSIDSDGKRLQIDDLIIISNNFGENDPPEGGSALQNLAKIASRYQKGGEKGEEGVIPNKRFKLNEDEPNGEEEIEDLPAAVQAVPPTTNAMKLATTPFSLLPPGLLPCWPLPGVADTPTSCSKSIFGLPDASKIGPEGLNLLQFYEKHLRSVQEGLKLNGGSASPSVLSANSPNVSITPSVTITKREVINAKSKSERAKVCKPPPDNKRPPSLMTTPCAFVRTTRIYSDPRAELAKVTSSTVKQSIVSPHAPVLLRCGSDKRGQRSGGILDLSSQQLLTKTATPFKWEYPPKMEAGNSSMLDLSLNSDNHRICSPISVKKESVLKSSPFSAEALINKPSPITVLHQSVSKLPTAASDYFLVKSSPSLATGPSPMHGPSSPRVPTRHPPSSRTAVQSQSPWHTPVSSSAAAAAVQAAIAAAGLPISPLVNDSGKDSPGLVTGNPSISSAMLAAAAALPPSFMLQPPVASPATSYGVPSQQQVAVALAASNPYLSLMSAAAGNLHLPVLSKPPGIPPTNPPILDPATSAYYAALYSQQMYGIGPHPPPPSLYGSSMFGGIPPSAGLRPGPTPSTSMPPPQPGANMQSTLPTMDQLQASAIQALLSRNPSASHPFNSANFSSMFSPGFAARKES